MAFFRSNPAFVAEMVRDPRYRASLHGIAQGVLAPRVRARAIAAGEPFMPRGGELIVVENTADGVRVANTDHGAFIAEVGSPSRNTPASAPLRGGAHDAGFRLREQ